MLFSNLCLFLNKQQRSYFLCCSLLIFSLTGLSQPNLLGENLTYSVSYGWVKIGEAKIFIDPELKYINEDPHYQVQCLVKTSSFIGFFKSIDYCYESLINVKTGAPLISYRNLKTGDDLDVRTNTFSRSDSINISAYIEDIDSYRSHSFSKEKTVLDFLSTFLFFRRVDFTNQQSIEINTFYSNTLYGVTLKEPRIGKTKWGNTHFSTSEFSLYFPGNEYFKNDKHGKVILLNDRYKTAEKINFNMTLGKISFQLEKAERD